MQFVKLINFQHLSLGTTHLFPGITVLKYPILHMLHLHVHPLLFILFDPVQTGIVRYPVHPCGQFGITLKGTQSGKYLYKDILCHLFRIFPVSQHPQGQGIYQVLVIVHQTGKGYGIAVAHFLDQFFFFIGQHCTLDDRTPCWVTTIHSFIKLCNLFLKTIVIAYEKQIVLII